MADKRLLSAGAYSEKKKQKTEAMGDSSDSNEFEITDLVHQFMAVTGAEDTVALSYLQQSSWNVEVCSVFFFFLLFYRFSFPFFETAKTVVCSMS